MVTGLASLQGGSVCEPSDQTPLLQEGSTTNYATRSSPPSAPSTVLTTPIPGQASLKPPHLHPHPIPPPSPAQPPAQPPQPSWSSLPHKAQLAVIVFARLAEPLSERSQTSYLFHQLRFFDPSLPPSAVVLQAGYLTATFAAAQCLTAMCWGRAADSPRWGRKSVLVVGLLGSAAAALGMGFARTLREAVVWRALAGGVNGNVGVLRTMVSEVVGERRYQSRAFLLLPMCYNVGVVIGPLLSGFLADPVRAMPSVFGPGGLLGGGGEHGNRWLLAFPYALPNLLFASVLGCAALAVVLGLDETHPQLRHEPDRGRRLGKMIVGRCLGRVKVYSPPASFWDETWSANGSASLEGARLLTDHDVDVSPCASPLEAHDHQRHTAHASRSNETDGIREEPRHQKPAVATARSSRLRALLTRNVVLTMLQRFLHALHMSAFYAIFSTLLPTPRASSSPASSSSPTTPHALIHEAGEMMFRPPFSFSSFFFSGGLGLSTQKMGFASTALGLLGLPLQILLYPRLVSRLGVRGSYRAFLPLSILAYLLLPLVVLVPEDRPGVMWTCLVGVLALQVVSRTFVNPATIMLVNDCAVAMPPPPPADSGGGGGGGTGSEGERGQILGTIHGLAVTVSSAARIIGPTAGGALLGWGLRNEFVALPLWLLAAVAGVNWVVLWWIRDVDME